MSLTKAEEILAKIEGKPYFERRRELTKHCVMFTRAKGNLQVFRFADGSEIILNIIGGEDENTRVD